MKKFLAVSALLLVFCYSYSQELYDINTIQTIEIVFEQDNWRQILDDEKAGENNYTEALSVTINGQTFNRVGVKYKGNSSYSPFFQKNPFHIELDTYVDQDYQGYTDLKLANVFEDPSFIRETLSYTVTKAYMHAPQANYANITVNGELIGLYTNVESISKKFVDKKFGSKSNAFFSCSPPDGAGFGNDATSGLEYLGTNISNYEDSYELKSYDDVPEEVTQYWNDLVELITILNNDTENIESVLDVDRALWMLAIDNVLVNIDSYIGVFKQNHYLYKDDEGKFNSVMWDLNMSFGVFSATGEPGPNIFLETLTEKQELTPLLHETNDAFPLVSKLLENPRYKKMYLAHYKTILNEFFTNSEFLNLATQYQNLIDASVQADQNKFFSYSQFENSIFSSSDNYPGIATLMDARAAHLSALPIFTNTQPVISGVSTSTEEPEVGDLVTFTVMVINTNSDAVFLGHRTNQFGHFTRIQMFDDGVHNDGAANDNVYGTDLQISNSLTQYYIYAENNNIGAFSPARAEHEFHSLDATFTTIAAGDLVINEIMASNETTIADQDGEFDDWIELYNNSSNTLSLDNLYLSDDANEMLAWQFPMGITIEPNSYLLVWCDEDLDQEGLHAGIKLSAGGESAILSYSDGTVIENITFGEQVDDMTYSRIPNGTGEFIIKAPTPNTNNESVMSVDDSFAGEDLRYYPNPTKSVLNIENTKKPINSVKVYSTIGELIIKKQFENQKNIQIDLSAYSKGVYFVVINNDATLKVIKN